MSLKRSLWFALRGCFSGALLVATWAVWLALVAALGLQVWVVTRRELELPDFALRAFERRLAASEITARFGRAVFDPTGRVLFERVQLFGPDQSVPLVTIRAAYASLEFLPLLVGEVRVHEIRLTGVDLRVPAMLSPSGTDEAVVSDLDGVFQAQRSDYHIAVCTFRVAGVAVTSHGRFHLPAGIKSRPGSLQLLDLMIERYLRAGRKLIALRPQIEALEEPRLQLTLTPSPDAGALVEAELLVDASHPEISWNVQSGRARTVFPLLGDAPVATEVMIDAERVAWRQQAQLTRLHVVLSGLLVPDRYGFTPQKVRLTAAEGRAAGFSFAAPAADLTVAEWPRVQGNVMLQAGEATLTARADVEARRGEGRIDLSASVTPELLHLAAARFGLKAINWVTLSEPASLQAGIDLAGGWKPVRTEGDISVRHARAHDVAIDAAGGHIVYAGHGLNVTDLTLLQGDNAAYGSYAMDTATNEYRFLLHGHLRPLDISGWFTGWWPRFWRSFDFAAAPPIADVDVAGRWGTARESVVFCHADAAQPGIRGVPFDRVRTTLFFRPDYFEVSEFKAERGGHSGQGSFTVAVDSDDSRYRTLEFEAVSDLDVAECARLYGPEGTALAAPFQFTGPPTVRVAGHFDGPGAPGGAHTQMHFTVETNNRVTLHGFPLDTMKFSANYHDGDLDFRDIEAGFAGGATTGWARIEGPFDSRTVAFEAKLGGADLARVITLVDELQFQGKPAGSDRPGEHLLRRASSSHLDGRLAASGRLGEPFSFHGDGELTVAGQELGEIHLLGLLSELLSKTLLDFTSLRLDSAAASFRIDGNKLVFPQVKLQGPRASIDAKGEYLLENKTLDFNARIYPLQESKFVLADALGALLTPLSNVLELKLTGPLEKPSWAFAFGPTSLLRAITRPPNGAPLAPNATPPPAPPLAPPGNSP
jgi:AsmA-like C-terminal region